MHGKQLADFLVLWDKMPERVRQSCLVFLTQGSILPKDTATAGAQYFVNGLKKTGDSELERLAKVYQQAFDEIMHQMTSRTASPILNELNEVIDILNGKSNQ